ncbi:MAG: hypothetical protein ACTSR8_16740 [Promethearchaeota archaeon]
MEKMKCKRCGNIIETIPLCCGYDITVNEETHQWECYTGSEQGYVSLNELLCSACCKQLAREGEIQKIC